MVPVVPVDPDPAAEEPVVLALEVDNPVLVPNVDDPVLDVVGNCVGTGVGRGVAVGRGVGVGGCRMVKVAAGETGPL